MAERNATGTFSAVVYFESPTGEISLPGTGGEDARGSNGWLRREARTWREVDALQRRMEEQDRGELRRQLERDEAILEPRRQKIRDRLLRAMMSGEKSVYEREFIREYLGMSDARKRRFYGQDKRINAYFLQREYDDAGAGLIEE